ncbi:MAG: hypothetical protein IBX72_03010 [Nitrospirae bacterium]|nr:hypothetical protein [Nitrospirota bacterium]
MRHNIFLLMKYPSIPLYQRDNHKTGKHPIGVAEKQAIMNIFQPPLSWNATSFFISTLPETINAM